MSASSEACATTAVMLYKFKSLRNWLLLRSINTGKVCIGWPNCQLSLMSWRWLILSDEETWVAWECTAVCYMLARISKALINAVKVNESARHACKWMFKITYPRFTGAHNIPVTIFLFTKDSLYMSVLSWKSIFDSVEPLQWNCTAIAWATLGPSLRVNLALKILVPLNDKTIAITKYPCACRWRV